MAGEADPYAGWAEVPSEPTGAVPKPDDPYSSWAEVPADAGAPSSGALSEHFPTGLSDEQFNASYGSPKGYQPIDFAQQLGAPEAPAEQAPSPLTDAALRVRDIVGSIVAPTTEDGVDKHAAILELSRKTGLSFNTVASRFDELYAAHQLAQTDPVQWMRENPQLGEFILNNPEAGVLVPYDPGVGRISRALNAITGFLFPSAAEVADFKKRSPQQAADIEGLFYGSKAEPGGHDFITSDQLELKSTPQLLKRDAQSEAVNADPFGFLYVPGLRSKETVAGLNADRLWFDIMLRRRRSGADTEETRLFESIANDYELQSQPRDYQQGEVGRFVSSAASGISSSLVIMDDVLKHATGVGLAGGVIGGTAVTALVGPEAAAEGFWDGLAIGSRLGAGSGAFIGTARLEGGGAYKDLLRSKLDDGTPVTEEMAAAGGLIYGGLSAAIEIGTMGPLLKALGPAGELIRTGSRKQALAALLKSPPFLSAMKRYGKQLGEATLAESGEEALQAMTKDAVSYFVGSVQAGTLQQGKYGVGGAVNLPGAYENFVEALPSSFVMGAGAVGLNIGQQHLFADRARESAKVVEVLSQFKDSPTGRSSPDELADALRGAGLGQSLFTSAPEFVRFNQERGVDLDKAAAQYLGPSGPQLLREALSGGTPLEVPVGTYLRNWSDTELADALAPHTTTAADLPTPKAIDKNVMQAKVDALLAQMDKEPVEPESAGEAAFVDVAEKQLAQVEGKSLAKAREKFDLTRAVVRVFADAFGQSADDLFKNFALFVSGGTEPTMEEQLRARLGEGKVNRAEELMRDEGTGLPNENAMAVTRPPEGKPLVGHLSVEGFKWLNDNLGHAKADLLGRAVALALHGVTQPFKVGGADFAFYVKDQAELDSVTAKVRAALPPQLRGFAITSAVGPTAAEAGRLNQSNIDRAVAEGQRANPRPQDVTGKVAKLPAERPRGLPADLKPDTLVFPEAKAAAVISPEAVKHVTGLAPADYFKAAYRDPITGEWTERAWNAMRRKAHVAMLDAAGLGLLNEKYKETYGKAVGNEMLRRIGAYAQALGGDRFDFTHLHGDEYAAQSDDAAELEGFVDLLLAHLAADPIFVPDRESGELHEEPVAMHHGFGERSLKAADDDLNARKARLAKARTAGLVRGGGEHARPGSAVRGEAGGAAGVDSGPRRFTKEESAGVRGSGQEGGPPPRSEVEQQLDYLRSKFANSRAPVMKAAWKALLDWQEAGGKAPFPAVPWAVESAAWAAVGFGDPKGFAGNEGGKDLRRAMKSRGYVKSKGVGLVGNAADMHAQKKAVPGSRGYFQEPNERDLFYQFPTPEESLARMQDEQFLRDVLLEHGVAEQTVNTADLLIEQLTKAVKTAHAEFSQITIIGPTAATARRSFEGTAELPSAIAYIRELSARGLLLGAFIEDTRSPAPDLESMDVANDAQLRDLGIATTPEMGQSVLPTVEADEDTGEEVLVEPTGTAHELAAVPESKNLPGQATLERGMQGGLGTLLKAAEGGKLAKAWVFESPGKSKGEGPRGTTEMFNEGLRRVYQVVLNPNADLSTFLHESAHVFLDLMSNLALRPDAPTRVRSDFAAALKYLGAKSAEDLKLTTAAKNDPARLRHEKFATAFERYLFEGKAPSAKLEGPMARYRLWLTKVYGRVEQVPGAHINDDIRRVFDRLIATDAEIAEQQQKAGSRTPMAAAVLGLNRDQFADHVQQGLQATSATRKRETANVLKDVLREKESWWKQQLAEEREKAKSEYEDLPARQAQQALANRGDIKIGALDRTKVVEAVGEATAAKLGKEAVKKGGADPGPVAEFFGFKSTEEMLTALLELKPKNDWVAETAETRMREKHPELLDEKTKLAEQIDKGLHGGEDEAFLTRELKLLSAKMTVPGQPLHAAQVAPIETAKAAAKQNVDNRSVRKLDAAAALEAERRSATAAIKAGAEGNVGRAFFLYLQRMTNFFTWKRLLKARELRDKFLELASELAGPKGQSRLGKASPVYRDETAAALGELGLGEPTPEGFSPDAVARQMEIDTAAGRTVVVGFDPDEISTIFAKLRLYGRGRPQGLAYTVLTVAELRTVHSMLENIKQAGKVVTTALVDGKRIDLQETADQIVAGVKRNVSPLPPPREKNSGTVFDDIGGYWNMADGAMVTIETMLKWLTNGNLEDITWRALGKPLQEAKHLETDLLNGPVKHLVETMDKMPFSVLRRATERFDGRAAFPTHTEAHAVPERRWQVLGMWMNMGNEGNKHRMLEGRNITEQQLRELSLKLGITKEEYDYVQAVLNAAQALKEPAFALEERDTGIRPEEVEATPIDTPFGQYPGGYFPAVYARSTMVGQRQELQLTAEGYSAAGTNHNYLKSRAPDFVDIISLDPNIIYRHVSQVAHDVAFRERLRSVALLVRNERVHDALVTRLGHERTEVFEKYLQDVGQQRGVEDAKAFYSAMQILRGTMSVSVLGFSFGNAFEDAVTGLTTALPAAGIHPKHMAVATAEVRNADKVAAAEAASGELRSRHKQLARDFHAHVELITSRLPAMAKVARNFITSNAFVMQEIIDRRVSAAVWIAAKRQALEGNPTPTAAQIALAQEAADRAVRTVLPSSHVVDSSQLMRNKGVLAAMLVFFRIWNTFYNQTRTLSGRDFIAGKDAKTVAKMGGLVLGTVFAYSILGSLARGQGKDKGEDWSMWFLRKMVTGFFSQIPALGELSEMGWWMAAGGQKREPRNNSIAGMLATIVTLLVRATNGDQPAEKRLKALGGLAGLTTGLPPAQLMRSILYLDDLVEGRVEARGPLDVIGGVLYGQSEHQGANLPVMAQDALEGVPIGTGP